jgi:hypothetical protein
LTGTSGKRVGVTVGMDVRIGLGMSVGVRVSAAVCVGLGTGVDVFVGKAVYVGLGVSEGLGTGKGILPQPARKKILANTPTKPKNCILFSMCPPASNIIHFFKRNVKSGF